MGLHETVELAGFDTDTGVVNHSACFFKRGHFVVGLLDVLPSVRTYAIAAADSTWAIERVESQVATRRREQSHVRHDRGANGCCYRCMRRRIKQPPSMCGEAVVEKGEDEEEEEGEGKEGRGRRRTMYMGLVWPLYTGTW